MSVSSLRWQRNNKLKRYENKLCITCGKENKRHPLRNCEICGKNASNSVKRKTWKKQGGGSLNGKTERRKETKHISETLE